MGRGSRRCTDRMNTHTQTNTHAHTQHTHALDDLFALSRQRAGLLSEVTDLQFVAVCQTADRWGKQRSLRHTVATVRHSAVARELRTAP